MDDFGVKLHCANCEGISQTANLFLERRKMTIENRQIDLLQGSLRWEGHVEYAEQGYKAWIDLVSATTSL